MMDRKAKTNRRLAASFAVAVVSIGLVASCSAAKERFGRVGERLRSIGNRGETSQPLPPPVGSLPGATTTATMPASYPVMNTGVNTGVAGGVTVTEAEINWTDPATRDYNGQYQADSMNKAFAIAPGGSYGVGHAFSTPEQAEAAAMTECRKDLQPGELDCMLFDRNGTIVLKLPTVVSRR